MNFYNRLFTCIIDEAEGVVGATPEGMGHHIMYVKCKNDTYRSLEIIRC